MSVFSRLADYLTGRDIERSLAVVPERRAAPYVLPAYQYQGGVATWPDRDVGKNIQAHYFNVAVVFRCVTVLSDAVAEAPLRVYQETEDGTDELPKRPVRRLLMRPNPQMSESEFHVFTVSLLALAGFCVIEKERSEAGRVVRLWHLRPDWLAPKYRDNAPPNWVYRVPGREPVTLDARNLIVVTYRSDPFFKATGVAPLDIVAREAAIDNVATDFVKNMFDRGGAPPLYLKWTNDKMPNPDPAIFDTVRELWAQKAAGAGNWTLPPVAANVEPVPIGWSPNDMAYPDLRYLSASRICSAFGVDERLVGVSNEQPTYENFEAAMRSLQLHTANPLRARLDGAFTRALLPEFEDDPTISLEFDTSNISVLQEDTDAKWKRYTAGWQAGGLTLDQFMSGIGEPAIGGKLGTARILPGNTSLIDEQGQVIASSTVAAINAGVGVDATSTNAARAASPPSFWSSLPVVTDDAPFDYVRPDPGEVRFASIRLGPIDHPRNGKTLARYANAFPEGVEFHPLPTETRASVVSTARDAMTRVADKHEPTLMAFWKAQGERVVGALGERAAYQSEGPPSPTVWELAKTSLSGNWGLNYSVRAIGDAVDWTAEQEELRVLLQALYNDAGEAAYAEVVKLLTDLTGDEPTIAFDISNPRIGDVADQLAKRIVAISEQTKVDVAKVVTDALSEGASTKDLTDKLKTLFTETYKNRARTVARTESQVSYNLANRLAYEDSGQVAAAELHDNRNHTEGYRASDGLTCAQRDGLIVPLDQVDRHVYAEHPNGSLSCAPVLSRPLGEA